MWLAKSASKRVVLGHVLALVLAFAGQKQPELCSGTRTSFRTRRCSTDGARRTLAMLEPLLLCSSRAKASRARAPELLCGAETYFWLARLSERAAALPLPPQSRWAQWTLAILELSNVVRAPLLRSKSDRSDNRDQRFKTPHFCKAKVIKATTFVLQRQTQTLLSLELRN